MADIVEQMKLLEIDHEPDGWPAVRMKEITELCDIIKQLRTQFAIAAEALERVVLYQAHNGDDWPARQAKEALATIKGDGK